MHRQRRHDRVRSDAEVASWRQLELDGGDRSEPRLGKRAVGRDSVEPRNDARSSGSAERRPTNSVFPFEQIIGERVEFVGFLAENFQRVVGLFGETLGFQPRFL